MYDGTAAAEVATTTELPVCRHCKERQGTRARGLCSTCHRVPAVRAKYASRRGQGSCRGGIRHWLRAACRHCGAVRASRPKGLCWTCYYTPGVRARYESTSKFSRRGTDEGSSSLLPPEPTQAAPGTEAKMQVMALRAQAGVALHHPADARINEE